MVAVEAADHAGRAIDLVISTNDPDDVDIVREVVWQIDPHAVQDSLVIANLHTIDDSRLAG